MFRRRNIAEFESVFEEINGELLMKRALLSIGAALALAVAVPSLANAQKGGGGRGGGGGGAAHAGGGGGAIGGGGGGAAIGGGGGGFARSGGGGFARSGGGAAISGGRGFVRSAPSGAFAAAPSGGPRVVQGGRTFGGQRFVQGSVQGRGDFRGRRHFFRGGPGFAFFGAAPYYDYDDYDYATPYAYDDSSCYQLRLYRGEYRRVWVCD